MNLLKSITKNVLAAVPVVAVIGVFSISGAGTIKVAKDGSGDFTTVQAALNSIPSSNTEPVTVFIKKGVYTEKDTLASGKQFVTIEGEDRDATIITFDDYNGKANVGTTSNTFTLTIDADNAVLKNITIQNSYRNADTTKQAVALRVKGNKVFVTNCRLDGFQDTYYLYGKGLVFTKKCIISGWVDFIFGSNRAAFDSCELRIKNYPKGGQCLTAPCTNKDTTYGFVFFNSKIVKDSASQPNATSYLGRPWHPTITISTSPDSIKGPDSAAIGMSVFIKCSMDSVIKAVGWDSMSGTYQVRKAGETAWTKTTVWFHPEEASDARFFEFGSTGAGAVTNAKRKVLTDAEASYYTIDKVLAGWNPEAAISMKKDTAMKFDFGSQLRISSTQKKISCKLIAAKKPYCAELFSADGKRVSVLNITSQSTNKYLIYATNIRLSKGVYVLKVSTSDSFATANIVVTE